MSSPGYRIVLQTGANTGFARVFAVAFTFGAVCAGGLVVTLTAAGDMPFPHRFLLPLVPVAFTGVSVVAHVVAWRNRATDLFVTPDGFRIAGGPHAGLVVRWAEVDADATRVEIDPTISQTVNGETTQGQKLILALRGATERVLAASTDPIEQLSFSALLATIREGAAPAARVVDDGPPDVVRCHSCGAPVLPADAPSAECWRCGSHNRIPDAVRARLHAQATRDSARARLERDLAVALRQPSANGTNAWLAASMFVPYLLPIALCAAPGPWNAWLALTVALVAASNLMVARRAAFHRLAVVFAARPPAEPGAPLRCRSCAGPLPTTDAAAVTCPWCEATNVRALQLERPAAMWQEAAQELSAFAAAHRARLRWPKLVLGFWLLAALVGFLLPPLE